MATSEPPVPRPDLVARAVCAGLFGHIQWQHKAYERVSDDPNMEGYTPAHIKEMLRNFVQNGGGIDARNETREQWAQERPDHPFWYRALVPAELRCSREIFVELILIDDDEQEPWVEIVNAHPQR